jgi:hypothetical protein
VKVESVPPAAGRVFISYRREETAYAAGWLFDRLADRFGRAQIFKDIDSIQLGDDFVEVINSAVGSCDVLLALIGDQWLTITDKHGNARLDNPDDFVRLEIEAALTRDVRVIPILVGRAGMPRAEELPSSLAKLVRRNALELSPSRFEFDTGRLLKVLERTLADVRAQPAYVQPPAYGPPPPKRGNGRIVAIIVAVLAVIALGVGAFLGFGGNNKNDSGQTTNRSIQTAANSRCSATSDTTTSTGKATKDQKEAAKVIKRFFRWAGCRDGTSLCHDADLADLQQLMNEQGIPCWRLDPFSATLRTRMRTMSIEARDIIVAGNVGVAKIYKPENFWGGPIRVRKNAAGAWKVRLLNN